MSEKETIGILRRVLINSRKFINAIGDELRCRRSDCYHNPHGTITMEWLNKHGEKFSIEIGATTFSYFITKKTPILVDGCDLELDTPKIKSQLEELLK